MNWAFLVVAVALFLTGIALIVFAVKRNGEVAMAGLSTTYSKGVDKIFNFVKNNAPIRDLAIVHSSTIEEAMKLRKRLGTVFPEKKSW